jgi:hypothetical protein
MKIKSLSVSVLCLAMLALSGCGKKSSDETPAPPVVTQPTSTTAITGLATKGPITGATVTAFAIRSDVTDTANPLGSAQTDAKGIYTVETFGYKGPVVVEVTGGSYTDEISGAKVTLKTPLRAMFSSVGTGTTTIAVTPLTELAAKKAEGAPVLTGDVIDAANRDIATFFGVTNIVTALPNAFSTDANQTGYAAALGVISQLVIDSMRVGDIAAGQTMDDALVTVMTNLGNEMQQTGVFSDASNTALALAINLFSSGGTTTPPSTTPPPVTPAGGVLKIGTSTSGTVAANGIRGILLTVALPVGVTVDINPLSTVPGSAAPGAVVVSGVAAVGKNFVISAIVTQSTSTTPGKVDIIVQNGNPGFGIGEFVTINFKLAPLVPLPALTDFAISNVTVQGIKLVPIDGVTVAPISVTPVP